MRPGARASLGLSRARLRASSAARQSEWILMGGSAPVGWVIRDHMVAHMWRWLRPDGTLSDYGSLGRAKDAALAAANLSASQRGRWVRVSSALP